MRFLIRDDDTCAFTNPEELLKCYEQIWDVIPINLSVTPFRIPGRFSGVPRALYGQEKPIPLAENPELVSFLKQEQSRGRLHIALHGYHHTMPHGLPEYVGGNSLFEKTVHGKAYLEQLLECRISTFVPPNNKIGRAGFDAIVRNGLNLVNIPSFTHPGCRPFRWKDIGNIGRVAYFKIIKKMRYPFVLRFHDHKEVTFHSVTPAQRMDTLITSFEQCRNVNGVFILAMHYHASHLKLQTDETISDVLTTFTSMVKRQPDMQFLTYDEMWQGK